MSSFDEYLPGLVKPAGRYDIPISIRGVTVELKQLAVAPTPIAPAALLIPYDSSDDDNVVVKKPYNWHVLDFALIIRNLMLR